MKWHCDFIKITLGDSSLFTGDQKGGNKEPEMKSYTVVKICRKCQELDMLTFVVFGLMPEECKLLCGMYQDFTKSCLKPW